MPVDVRREIEALDPEAAPTRHERGGQVLGRHAVCDSIWAGLEYYFARRPSPAEFRDVAYQKGCHVVGVGGVPVSWAWTSEASDEAEELAVETAPEHRRRGYARRAVSAWAARVLDEGKVALYSHETGNVAS